MAYQGADVEALEPLYLKSELQAAATDPAISNLVFQAMAKTFDAPELKPVELFTAKAAKELSARGISLAFSEEVFKRSWHEMTREGRERNAAHNQPSS